MFSQSVYQIGASITHAQQQNTRRQLWQLITHMRFSVQGFTVAQLVTQMDRTHAGDWRSLDGATKRSRARTACERAVVQNELIKVKNGKATVYTSIEGMALTVTTAVPPDDSPIQGADRLVKGMSEDDRREGSEARKSLASMFCVALDILNR